MKIKNPTLKIFALCSAFAVGIATLPQQNNVPTRLEAAVHEDNYALYTYSGSYYDTIDFDSTGGMNGALRSSLASLVRPAGFYTYSSSGETHLSTQLQYADEDPNNSNNMIMFYTRNSITKTAATVGGTIKWNREHVWCQSLSNDNWGTTEAGTDILHLRPTYESTNKSRGNDVYGDNHKSGPKYYNDMLYGYMGGTYFEPIDSVKGDVARIIMYLWTTYTGYNSYNSLNILDIFQSYDVLLKWHTEDKPDVMEGNRNNYSESSKQKNRNPFVDHPELGWKIFGDQASVDIKNACMAAYPANGGDPIDPTGIRLNKSTASLETGRTLQLNAILEPSGATGSVSWSTNNNTVASVSNSGLVTANVAGNATITATCNGYSASCDVTVVEATNNYGTIDNPLSVSDAIELINGIDTPETAQPLFIKGIVSSNTAYNSQHDNYNEIWLEDDNGVADSFELFRAKLDDSIVGNYSAANSMVGKEVVVYGRGKIYNNQPELSTSNNTPSNPIVLSITAPEATGIELNRDTANIEVGGTVTLTASLIPDNATSEIIWESSNNGVAIVDNGVVAGVSAGQATITARVDGTDIEAECVVTVTGGTPIQTGVLEIASSISVGDTVYLGCNYAEAQYYGPSGTTQDAFGTYVFYDDEPDATTYPLEVCAGNSIGTYALKIKAGDEINKYLAYSGTKNSLKVTSTLDDTSSWTIVFNGSNNATITNVANTSRVIWWNASSPRFACYVDKANGDNFKYVQLWKEVSAQPNGPEQYLNNTNSYMELTANESLVPETNTVTKTINSLVTEKGWSVSSGSNINGLYTSFDLDDIVNISTTGAANCGSVWGTTTYDWRLYQNKNGNIIISASGDSKITSITLKYNATNKGILKYGDTTLSSNLAVAIDSLSSVIFTVDNSDTATNGQIKITSISVTYSTSNTVVDSVAINYGARISKADWDAINALEDYEITDYGAMLVKKNTLVNTYHVSSVQEAYEADEAVYIANKGSGVIPNEDGDDYYFYIQLKVTRATNYGTVYVAAPFIKVNNKYYFLDELECSVNSLAQNYLDNGGSNLSVAALNILAGN